MDIMKSVALICLVIGVTLLAINIYGLTQDIRKPGLGVNDQEHLRLIPEEVWSYQKSKSEIKKLKSGGSISELAEEANQIVHKSLVHVKWTSVSPTEYRQLVPIWENYFLWAVGKFSGLPQFERYHYANYLRSIKRGIGICGDASTALSTILDKYNIDNRIISFDGHVIVEYKNENRKWGLLDPDFGVSLDASLEILRKKPGAFRNKYENAGVKGQQVSDLIYIYNKDYSIFEDTYHFMTLRYIFEEATYILKWLFPGTLTLLSLIYLRRRIINNRKLE
ncbi:hypothetical protein BKP64_04590 [Marinobacter salinus]|uniref:Transglutaminase-like domain-containing protein n=1 Tax=Marinobacter salinus TaxID=1874317 RepID=A0A1D9GIN8_9GAMM|nr:hypothetical protein [Marinobacter salinus]AOY87507.1 hypothetical protein BKP64_04590 [Marinobacter salinus]